MRDVLIRSYIELPDGQSLAVVKVNGNTTITLPPHLNSIRIPDDRLPDVIEALNGNV
jgi:hypothetical protein